MVDCTLVVFGITGDLAATKILPALQSMLVTRVLDKFALIGTSRSVVSMQTLIDQARKSSTSSQSQADSEAWNQLSSHAHALPLDVTSTKAWAGFAAAVKRIEQKEGVSGNRVFYLATLPTYFEAITKNLAASGLLSETSKIVYEKPFGYDLASARSINKSIRSVLRENQVFRMDHYLGKELVGNIALVRFTNRILEPLWNKQHIQNVQIVLSETKGVGTRGEFYEKAGALRDVVQNHILQILSLVAMEEPSALSGETVRDQKAKVLSRVIVDDVLLGQYNDYLSENKIPSKSQTETFAALKLGIKNARWKGVPFYVKTGKKLAKAEAVVYINFRPVACKLQVCPTDTNFLEIRIQPDEGIILELNGKLPGEQFAVVPVRLSFSHKEKFQNSPQAYASLLADIVRGNQSFFVRNDEIESAWKIVDAAKARKTKLLTYVSGSKGPGALQAFEKKHKMRWRS